MTNLNYFIKTLFTTNLFRIYIYIYMCVCMCVCSLYKRSMFHSNNSSQTCLLYLYICQPRNVQ